jgi:lambda family phage portal protein
MATPATRTRKPKRTVFNATAEQGRISARYDVARTTEENASLWNMVDSLSAAAANNPQVRKTIRERARYEVANNCYAKGLVKSLVSDVIGPEVQLQLGDSERAQEIEQAFADWAHESKLWAKLRTMYTARIVDGEAFAIITNNRKHKDIRLDIRPIECDMVESWVSGIAKSDEIDGIKFDSDGNPTQYRVLKTHPGDHRAIKLTGAGDWVSANYVMHLFREDRPGQVRGVSELTPALSLFGVLRKFTMSVLEAANRAAEISAVMQTNLVPDSLAAELADPVTIIEAQRNAIVSLPEGWSLSQLRPEQPSTTYAMFKAEIINEIARALNVPFNVAAGNSSGYNYASGRLDHQTYDRMIEIDRHDIATTILDRVYAEWLTEYATRHSMSDEDRAIVASHEWHFAGRGHVDPNKEANADDTRLKNGTLTHAAYYAKQGKDWKREHAQWIRERIASEVEWNAARAAAGLSPAPYPGEKETTTRTEPTEEEEIERDE